MYATLTVEGLLDLHEGIPTYDQLKEGVGGWLEAVAVPGIGDMYLNEEGKLDGLPLNLQATRLCTVQQTGLMAGDYIAGNVVLVGEPDDEGNSTGLTEAAIERLREVIV